MVRGGFADSIYRGQNTSNFMINVLKVVSVIQVIVCASVCTSGSVDKESALTLIEDSRGLQWPGWKSGCPPGSVLPQGRTPALLERQEKLPSLL